LDRIRWAVHVARLWERRIACRVLVGKPEGIRQLENLGVVGTIILKRIFKKE